MKYVSDHIKAILAIFITAASFAYFFFTYFIGKTQADPQIIIAIIAAMSQVLNYYFGSSQGSNKKDEVIATLQEAKK